MRRREFLTAMGGAAAWPFAARAQQPNTPVIGYLDTGPAERISSALSALRRGLKDAGYIEGENVAVVSPAGNGQIQNMPQLARELVQLKVAAIVAFGAYGSVQAAAAATSTIPIVYGGGIDLVRVGLAKSLNHPGGNVTGITAPLNGTVSKRLDLMLKLVPEVTTIGYVFVGRVDSEVDNLLASAHNLGREIIAVECQSLTDIENAFSTMAERGAGAVLVGAFAPAFYNRKRILELAASHRIPAIYAQAAYVYEGGLMSYGPTRALRQLAVQYVARILKGAKPDDLPIQQQAKFRFIINSNAARALGLDIPSMLLATADEVIER
jgi:putative ABC transport system substrate-binding protein